MFLSILFYNFFTLVLKRQTERQCYQHLLTLFVIFYHSNTEGTNCWIMFISFTFVKCACFVLYSTSVRFDLVKSTEVTLCS